jgi:hypothetical protein
MALRFGKPGLAVAFLAALPLVAAAQSETRTVAIVRSTGACPSSIGVIVVTKQYPGGFTMDYTARTSAVANGFHVVTSTPQRIAYSGSLLAKFSSCAGTGRSGDVTLTLRAGKLSYVISPGKGPNGTYPGALHVNIEKGLPHANVSITD